MCSCVSFLSRPCVPRACVFACLPQLTKNAYAHPCKAHTKKAKQKKKRGGAVYCDLWNQDNDCAVLSISEGHHMAAVTVTLSSTHQIGTTLESLSARGGIASPRYPPAIHISPGSSQHAEIKSGHQSYLLLSSFLGEIRMAELPLFG